MSSCSFCTAAWQFFRHLQKLGVFVFSNVSVWVTKSHRTLYLSYQKGGCFVRPVSCPDGDNIFCWFACTAFSLLGSLARFFRAPGRRSRAVPAALLAEAAGLQLSPVAHGSLSAVVLSCCCLSMGLALFCFNLSTSLCAWIRACSLKI